ncbi:PsiF family protein [Pseudomonas sp. DTU_2021_1001937_2_SI_NGA_ILE_001]|uniref:PsiF family protein n=1 Tax=Pseudomonas sp. DTU_2021_1001937_2_SI_NGA_ILE_001 TaxID=3077589 RepID=UPI0025F9FE77|nr:PsiF family protein [Pseudomonas sp. DTU_2021_1001937_2_SI_NGA_ILE_001]WNW13156.1 PsiF family protein [Pseudomonas sp. DTU_2021_1001937_2_SI_NGA_ILE_001]
MNRLHVPLVLLGCLVSAPTPAANPQQEKMASCNSQASTRALQGDQRKAFMSACLKASPATPQERMTLCNASASAQALKGEPRQRFMSDCLRKK